jgi:hypothetical protein
LWGIKSCPDGKEKTETRFRMRQNQEFLSANMEDIRMAKELGISPQSLRKNKHSPSQPWKQPVKEWIRELHEKHFGSGTGTPETSSY